VSNDKLSKEELEKSRGSRGSFLEQREQGEQKIITNYELL
jgi:hypothetical protein